MTTTESRRGAPIGNQRAAKPGYQQRKSRVTIWCTEAEKAEITESARQAGLSVSDWARSQLRRG